MNNAGDSAQRLQSNDEVIEELTTDLKSSCIQDENVNRKGSNSWDITDSEQNEINDNARETAPADDVDEEFLKDRDLSLSEDELEVRFLYLSYMS
jgi:hypothetical protein